MLVKYKSSGFAIFLFSTIQNKFYIQYLVYRLKSKSFMKGFLLYMSIFFSWKDRGVRVCI